MYDVRLLATRLEGVMRRSVGIDISTCTGMALVGPDGSRGKTVEIPLERGMTRLQLIANDVKRTLLDWHPEVVVIEGYAYTKNISSFVVLVEIGTMIRMVMHQLCLPWFEVPVPVLKKWTTGLGNAPKEIMAMHVMQRWGFKSPSNDIIDAYALAQMGQLELEALVKIPGIFSEHR